jgi:hypothetical protein
MHLLLTFLALLTGFSAAQAARPVEAASPTSAASEIELAEAVAIAAVANSGAAIRVEFEAYKFLGETKPHPVQASTIVASTPVSRADRART